MGSKLLRSTDPVELMPVEQWRHMALTIDLWVNVDTVLNQHGLLGWQLVTVFPINGRYHCILKRKVSSAFASAKKIRAAMPDGTSRP